MPDSHNAHDAWCVIHVISSGVHVLGDSCPLAREILMSESSSLSGCCCSGWVFSGCCWPDMARWWKEAPPKNFTTASPWARIPKLMHTYHCSHASHITHHVCCDCLAPQYWEYYPNIRLHYIGHPVTVVTSGELWNQNQAVSKTETWQLYGALVTQVDTVSYSSMLCIQWIIWVSSCQCPVACLWETTWTWLVPVWVKFGLK